LAFQRAIVLNRSYAIAYVYLGVSLERQGNIKDAETVYDYIKKQFPDGADAIDKLKAGTVETPAPTVDDTTATPSANTTTQKQPVKTTKTPVAPTTKKQ
jgi:tetratricopeptide (TPR) repeat protein